ncbi:hypothetical protein F5Y19DRAFT_450945 [Xylariaceae sp. FL1651]|nr:hypothetical protein F5Y19DRAFT_450945 [Xylariaceae sp. FL1651]
MFTCIFNSSPPSSYHSLVCNSCLKHDLTYQCLSRILLPIGAELVSTLSIMSDQKTGASLKGSTGPARSRQIRDDLEFPASTSDSTLRQLTKVGDLPKAIHNRRIEVAKHALLATDNSRFLTSNEEPDFRNADTHHKKGQSQQLLSSKSNVVEDNVEDDLDYVAEALRALAGYNKLLEEKVAKFNIQVVRSLAALRKARDFDGDITIPEFRTTEMKLRKLLHVEQIARLRNSFDARGRAQDQRLEEFSLLFRNEVLFLNCFDKFFDNKYDLAAARDTSTVTWDEYDRVLWHIQQWGHIATLKFPQGEAVVDDARRLVSQLVYMITEHCKVQLSTVFHENLEALDNIKTHTPTTNTAKGSHTQALDDERKSILREIDWLWEEVIPVAHMCVSAQFLHQVLKQVKNWQQQELYRNSVVTTYAAGVLRFLNERLEAVAERTQMLVYHHQTLRNSALYYQLMKRPAPVPTTLRHTMARNTKPFRSNATAVENLRYIMELYGAIPMQVDNSRLKPGPSLLEEYVQKRAQKGDTFLQDLHKLFEAATKSGLTDTELGVEMLQESLFADSSASSKVLSGPFMDPQIEKPISMLRSQAKLVQEVFKELKLDGPAAAPDFVAHAYRQTADRLAAKDGEDCWKSGQNTNPACLTCIRCLKFEAFLRKWGC